MLDVVSMYIVYIRHGVQSSGGGSKSYSCDFRLCNEMYSVNVLFEKANLYYTQVIS